MCANDVLGLPHIRAVFWIRVFPAPKQNPMNRKFKAIFLFTGTLRYCTALCTPQFSRNRIRFPSIDRYAPPPIPELPHRNNSALHHRYAASTPNHRLHSARNYHALLHATPRILSLLRCCVTNPKSGRALGRGSAQCFLLFGFGLATY